MSISDWPEELRPRERLMAHGARSLSDAELLAIFLRSGIPGKSAVDLGRELISHFGSLKNVFNASVLEFSRLSGLGPAKYAQLQAAGELARRGLREQLAASDILHAPHIVKEFLQLSLGQNGYESFAILFLDVGHKLLAYDELFRGTLTQTSVYPREVLKAALRHNAAGVILAHNHPSGAARPSKADRHLTGILQKALGLVDIKVHDHFIVAGDQWYSFAQHGELAKI